MTDGSFVDYGSLEDVESDGQSLSMIEDGRLKEGTTSRGK